MLNEKGISVEGVQLVMLIAVPLVIVLAVGGFFAFRRLKRRK